MLEGVDVSPELERHGFEKQLCRVAFAGDLILLCLESPSMRWGSDVWLACSSVRKGSSQGHIFDGFTPPTCYSQQPDQLAPEVTHPEDGGAE